MANHRFQDVFGEIYDVIVVGAGYAAFSAVLELNGLGKKVLLVNMSPGLLWESSRAYACGRDGDGSAKWESWRDRNRKTRSKEFFHVSAGVSEIMATAALIENNIPALYYACPLDVEIVDRHVVGLIVATKNGLKRLIAKQWVDATEHGELIGKCEGELTLKKPAHQIISAYYQSENWDSKGSAVSLFSNDDFSVKWGSGCVSRERCMQVEVGGDYPDPRKYLVSALRVLHDELKSEMESALLTHTSYEPYYCYEEERVLYDSPVRNVAVAVPGLTSESIKTLGNRYDLGLRAVERLSTLDSASSNERFLENPIEKIGYARQLKCDVCVAGAGTGGALAAIAAGREGVEVICAEAQSYPGGIGTAGGIHSLYYGALGGLQREVDERVAEINPLFATGDCTVNGFHPEAKRLVLETMMREANVSFMPNAVLHSAEVEDGRMVSADFATNYGNTRLKAASWVDATGDGDLCAVAGVDFRLGRPFDGRSQAYSQPACATSCHNDARRLFVVNFDTGWVDPTNSEDLTKAKITGIYQYYRDRFDDENYPIHVYPLLGVRQGRLIETDYTVTLADIIERRRFDDCVGYAGAWLDNHSEDYQFESDEQVLWFWGCRAAQYHTFSDIPYRSLLPKSLNNVWIGCRALGVSDDAHNSLRMQRDMQRIGEVAGLAAALAISSDRDSRSLDLKKLQAKLNTSGSLNLDTITKGIKQYGNTLTENDPFDMDFLDVEKGLAKLRNGEASVELWGLYRNFDKCENALLEQLREGSDNSSWQAAVVLGMKGCAEAEGRLLKAIATSEQNGEFSRFDAPCWYVALALLRICGTGECIQVLSELSGNSDLSFNTKTMLAVTLERLCRRGVVKRLEEIESILANLEKDVKPYTSLRGHHLAELFFQNKLKVKPETLEWQLKQAIEKIRALYGL